VSLPADLQLLSLREVDDNRRAIGKRPIVVRRQPVITGANLTSAEVRPGRSGGLAGSLLARQRGCTRLRDFTGANVGKQLAIVLDDTVFSAR